MPTYSDNKTLKFFNAASFQGNFGPFSPDSEAYCIFTVYSNGSGSATYASSGTFTLAAGVHTLYVGNGDTISFSGSTSEIKGSYVQFQNVPL